MPSFFVTLLPLLVFGALSFVPTSLPAAGVSLSLVFYAGLLLNTPHFLLSIHLFYREKTRRIPTFDIKHHFAAWGFPLAYWSTLVLAVYANGYLWIQNLHRLTLILILWHFARQSFGVMLLQLGRGKFTLSKNARFFLQSHLILLASTQWISQNTFPIRVHYFGMAFTTFQLPGVLLSFFSLLSALTGMIHITQLYQTQKSLSQRIPWEAAATLLTTWTWLFPMGQHPLFLLLLPAMHSIQHLAIAIPTQKKLFESRRTQPIRSWIQVGLFIVIGVLLLHEGTNFLDRTYPLLSGNVGLMGWQFAVMTFFNLHHYVIEYVLWSGGAGDIKKVAPHESRTLTLNEKLAA